MGFFGIFKGGSEGKEARREASEKVKQTFTSAGQRIGSNIGEAYNRRYGGGEYREARIKKNIEKAREIESRTRLSKAKSKYKTQRGSMFAGFGGGTRDLSYTTGGSNQKAGSRMEDKYSFITGGSAKKKSDKYSHIFGNRNL